MTPIVDPALEAYAHDHTKPRPELFDEIREFTYSSMRSPQMQVGRVEGTLLKTLVAISGARRVLEIGTFTGYSALSMAEALPDGGELVTCDVDPRATEAARGFFDRSPHGKKITIALGDATKTIAAMPLDPPFDLAFIDADKTTYGNYYDLVLPRLKKGGLIVADNTLWSGKVLKPSADDDRAICAFNDKVHADPRVENVLLTVRDGMMLARKL
jgi:caffeoyl-CoA O-methyltransferase